MASDSGSKSGKEKGQFVCMLCKLDYPTAIQFEEHLWSMLHHKAIHDNKPSSKHHCNLCMYETYNFSDYAKHLIGEKHRTSLKERKSFQDQQKAKKIATSKTGLKPNGKGPPSNTKTPRNHPNVSQARKTCHANNFQKRNPNRNITSTQHGPSGQLYHNHIWRRDSSGIDQHYEHQHEQSYPRSEYPQSQFLNYPQLNQWQQHRPPYSHTRWDSELPGKHWRPDWEPAQQWGPNFNGPGFFANNVQNPSRFESDSYPGYDQAPRRHHPEPPYGPNFRNQNQQGNVGSQQNRHRVTDGQIVQQKPAGQKPAKQNNVKSTKELYLAQQQLIAQRKLLNEQMKTTPTKEQNKNSQNQKTAKPFHGSRNVNTLIEPTGSIKKNRRKSKKKISPNGKTLNPAIVKKKAKSPQEASKRKKVKSPNGQASKHGGVKQPGNVSSVKKSLLFAPSSNQPQREQKTPSKRKLNSGNAKQKMPTPSKVSKNSTLVPSVTKSCKVMLRKTFPQKKVTSPQEKVVLPHKKVSPSEKNGVETDSSRKCQVISFNRFGDKLGTLSSFESRQLDKSTKTEISTSRFGLLCQGSDPRSSSVMRNVISDGPVRFSDDDIVVLDSEKKEQTSHGLLNRNSNYADENHKTKPVSTISVDSTQCLSIKTCGKVQSRVKPYSINLSSSASAPLKSVKKVKATSTSKGGEMQQSNSSLNEDSAKASHKQKCASDNSVNHDQNTKSDDLGNQNPSQMHTAVSMTSSDSPFLVMASVSLASSSSVSRNNTLASSFTSLSSKPPLTLMSTSASLSSATSTSSSLSSTSSAPTSDRKLQEIPITSVRKDTTISSLDEVLAKKQPKPIPKPNLSSARSRLRTDKETEQSTGKQTEHVKELLSDTMPMWQRKKLAMMLKKAKKTSDRRLRFSQFMSPLREEDSDMDMDITDLDPDSIEQLLSSCDIGEAEEDILSQLQASDIFLDNSVHGSEARESVAMADHVSRSCNQHTSINLPSDIPSITSTCDRKVMPLSSDNGMPVLNSKPPVAQPNTEYSVTGMEGSISVKEEPLSDDESTPSVAKTVPLIFERDSSLPKYDVSVKAGVSELMDPGSKTVETTPSIRETNRDESTIAFDVSSEKEVSPSRKHKKLKKNKDKKKLDKGKHGTKKSKSELNLKRKDGKTPACATAAATSIIEQKLKDKSSKLQATEGDMSSLLAISLKENRLQLKMEKLTQHISKVVMAIQLQQARLQSLKREKDAVIAALGGLRNERLNLLLGLQWCNKHKDLSIFVDDDSLLCGTFTCPADSTSEFDGGVRDIFGNMDLGQSAQISAELFGRASSLNLDGMGERLNLEQNDLPLELFRDTSYGELEESQPPEDGIRITNVRSMENSTSNQSKVFRISLCGDNVLMPAGDQRELEVPQNMNIECLAKTLEEITKDGQVKVDIYPVLPDNEPESGQTFGDAGACQPGFVKNHGQSTNDELDKQRGLENAQPDKDHSQMESRSMQQNNMNISDMHAGTVDLMKVKTEPPDTGYEIQQNESFPIPTDVQMNARKQGNSDNAEVMCKRIGLNVIQNRKNVSTNEEKRNTFCPNSTSGSEAPNAGDYSSELGQTLKRKHRSDDSSDEQRKKMKQNNGNITSGSTTESHPGKEVANEPSSEGQNDDQVSPVTNGWIINMHIIEEKMYACISDSRLIVFNLQTNTMITEEDLAVGDIKHVKIWNDISHSKMLLLASDGTKNLVRFDVQEKKFLQTLLLNDNITSLHICWDIAYIGMAGGTIAKLNVLKSKPSSYFDCSSSFPVTAIASALEGGIRLLVVAAGDKTLTVRQAQDGMFFRDLFGHMSIVTQLQVSDGLVISLALDNRILLHDLESGSVMKQIQHQSAISCFTKAASILAVAGATGRMYYYNTKNDNVDIYDTGCADIKSLTASQDRLFLGMKKGLIDVIPLCPSIVYTCQWSHCLSKFLSVEALQNHVTVVHVMLGNRQCLWKGCLKNFPQDGTTIKAVEAHVMSHIKALENS